MWQQTRPMTRKQFLQRTAAAGLALPTIGALIAACGRAEPPTAAPTTPQPGGAVASPESQPTSTPTRTGGEVRIALYSEPPTLDSTWTTAIVVLVPSQHVFEYLFAFDSRWDVKPMLADGFEVSDDGLIYTISLRKGVPFHNGKEMTSEDVVASLQRWGQLSGEGKSAFERVTTIEGVDPYTVRIELSSPFAPLIPYLGGPAGGGAIIMPKEVAEAAGTERLQEYVGTGPYKFVEHIPDRHIRLARFEEYAARDEPPDAYAGRRTAYFDEVLFIPVPNAASRIAGVEAGDYHWAEEVTRDEYERLKGSADVEPVIIKPLRTMNIVLNKQVGPFTDVRLRQAVLYAVDCEEILAAAFGPQDFWRLNHSLFPPESVWYSEAAKEQYNTKDVDRARQLVEESGYGGELIRWMAPADREDYFAVAVTGTQQLQAIGLNVELVSMDWGSLVDRRTQPDQWEIFNTGFTFPAEPTQLTPIPDSWPGWWVSEQKTQLLTALLEENDFERRKEIWDQFQTLYYEEVPVVQVGEFFGLSVKRRSLRGENLPISSFPIFWNAWFEE